AARIGLIVAIAIKVIGRAGMSTNINPARAKMQEIKLQAEAYSKRFYRFTNDQKREFLKLGILNEILSRRVGQVGRFERNLFFEAFRVLIEQSFEVDDMEVCWR